MSRAIIDTIEGRDGKPVVYRYAGDRFLLVEYGEMELDLTVNFRILGYNEELKRRKLPGLVETVPALRTILIQYDSLHLPLARLLAVLEELEREVPAAGELTIASRRVRLPIAFDDPWTREDIGRYAKLIREDAPNVVEGHNIRYIADYNGLDGPEQVFEHVLATGWWNACLGFWPGLPFMFPLDPRHAIVVPKYNPTRPWTPEGAVGIGGPCVAIYPVQSPGGYQLFGRTIQIYDPKQRNRIYRENPILLRPADQVEFERVSSEELEELRRRVDADDYEYRIEEDTVVVRDYVAFVESARGEAERFRRRQEEASAAVAVP